MASLKCPERPGRDTLPGKKGKCNQPDLEERVCVSCAKQPSKDDDVLGCVWRDGVQHQECLQISIDQYSVLTDLPKNIVFICSRCVNHYALALIEYDKCNEMHEVVDKKLEKFEVSLSNKFIHLKDELNSMAAKIGSSVEELNKLDSQIKGSMNQGLVKCGETMIATLDNRLNNQKLHLGYK